MSKKVAIILSGCGFKDGSEITEAVACFVALSEFHVDYDVFAPDIEITSVNHLSGKGQEQRNALVESARIARGNIQNLQSLNVDQYDGVVFPGGYGAVTLLCGFSTKGAECSVNAQVESLVKAFHSQAKPIAALCIAPAVIARILGEHNIAVTIGDDPSTATEIEKTGAQHVKCTVEDFVTDRENKIISTPAYMYEAAPHQVFRGIQKALKEFAEMA
jgi:enhancing lycopene biosynthesis protein 2